jgi:hypothetical protein
MTMHLTNYMYILWPRNSWSSYAWNHDTGKIDCFALDGPTSGSYLKTGRIHLSHVWLLMSMSGYEDSPMFVQGVRGEMRTTDEMAEMGGHPN